MYAPTMLISQIADCDILKEWTGESLFATPHLHVVDSLRGLALLGLSQKRCCHPDSLTSTSETLLLELEQCIEQIHCWSAWCKGIKNGSVRFEICLMGYVLKENFRK
ncbi:hypothetical protein CEXT_551501 [Caerostris extrusa]|uniref:Uncharacterized protein n=1 Tax=Caerostris extrusa TaxID=172846 RepID=A0AAV4SSW6_CAEEX|nr:hypothetical protein CEXT_551501 [Caerostris extrusa]